VRCIFVEDEGILIKKSGRENKQIIYPVSERYTTYSVIIIVNYQTTKYRKSTLAYKADKNGVKTMQQKIKIQFSNLPFESWQNLIIFTIIVFYSISVGYAIGKSPILSGFAGDYLAFWSAGKIADEKGYSEIYNLKDLKSVQLQELKELGLLNKFDTSSYAPIPVPLLAIFVFPFQVLSRINFKLSFLIWTSINLIVMIGYLIYFTKNIFPGNLQKVPGKKLLLLMLISYPVFRNFSEGQVQVFLVVCAGEFIHQAINQKPVLSGLWLGGLLLKPQLLILIIPILLCMHYWKAVSGFIISSIILLVTSFLLSGFAGIKAMVDLWTRYSAGMATNAPERMLNWRMIGVNINSILGTSFGWVITGLGMALTIVFVCILIKGKPSFGSSAWIITMAAVFSATLAVTWHSHDHMAVVLIPFLIYASQFNLLSEKVIFSWAVGTLVMLMAIQIIAVLFFFITKKSISGIGYWIAITGFSLNLLILISSSRYLHTKQNISEMPFVDNPTA